MLHWDTQQAGFIALVAPKVSFRAQKSKHHALHVKQELIATQSKTHSAHRAQKVIIKHSPKQVLAPFVFLVDMLIK